MRRAKKKVSCLCGAAFKINMITLINPASVNCPLCGRQVLTNSPDLKKYVDEMTGLKYNMASSGQPYKAIANYAYHKKYGDKSNPLEKYNILID